MNPHPIIAAFSLMCPLSAETIEDFASIIACESLPKNKMLLDFGQKATSLYLIDKGLARAYYNRDDVEITYYFAIDGQLIGSVPSLFDGNPSQVAIQLIEPSDVYSFRYQDFEACCAKHHDLERAARKLSTLVMLRSQEDVESLRFHTAKERYELIEKRHPGITHRCPLKFIASYIGTSQVSLSRIRAGIQ